MMLTYKLEKLQVSNFRNLDESLISFGDKINCIFGDNGNGKTNILEAIQVLSTKKSFRKNTGFAQYLSIDSEQNEIQFLSSITDSNSTTTSLSGKMDSSTNVWFINGKPSKKKPHISTIFINPFDSFSFHNQASFRRSWIDNYLSQINPSYKKCLSAYTKALRQRNNLLSQKTADIRGQIKVFDQQLASNSVVLTRDRCQFLKELNEFVPNIFKQIFSEDHQLEISLDSKVIGQSEEKIFQMLQSNLEKDLITKRTSYLVHKDDYTLLFNGFNSFEFCSLGQQKMSYLSLLFAYIELFRYKFMSFPIVLIDDVSGELDLRRWQNLIHFLEQGEFQVFISTANDEFRKELEKIPNAKKFFVKDGVILNQ